MSKLDNLTYYSKLQDLFDTVAPADVLKRINEAIVFIRQNVKRYETANKKSLPEAHQGYDMLVRMKQTFEDALVRGDSA